MKRGVTVERETPQGLVLERKMITRHDVLELMRGRCIGCDMCVLGCPQEAISYRPGVVEDGHLVQKPSVDIDPARCNFCGECVVLCPMNALRQEVNGLPELPVVQYGAFPELVKEIAVNGVMLAPEAVDACEASCPTRVIRVWAERDGEGRPIQVTGIEVDESNCIYCEQCQAACPGVFTVRKPWQGRVVLHVSRCPEGCRACAEACPTDALAVREGQLVLDERFCLYCGACQRVCPVEGAIRVERRHILHTPIQSGAWRAAVERLISMEAVALEYESKSQAKRRQALAYLPSAHREEGR